MSALAGTPATHPDVPSCPPLLTPSFALGAVELDGQGVLEVVVPPASRWAGGRTAPVRRPGAGRRWGGLGRRLGPCPLALPALAAIEGARVLGARAWREVAASAMATVRSDYAKTLGAIVTALADDAENGSTSAPTWPALAAAAGCVERTVGRWIAWLRQRRLLVTAEHGSTEATRPASMALEGNRAAVYLLTQPLPDLDEPAAQAQGRAADVAPVSVTDVGVTPPALPLRRRGRKPTRGRANRHKRGEQHPAPISPPWGAAGKDAEDEEGRREGHQSGYQRADGRTRGDQRAADLAIAAALRRSALDLRSISDAAVRSVIRPLTATGWGVADLIHAIDHEPDGTRRWYTSAPALPVASLDVDGVAPQGRRERPAVPVGSPVAWLHWRLRAWQGLPGPATARRAATIDGQRAATARATARREANAATQAASTTAPAGFAAARAALRVTTRPSAAQRSFQPWVPADLATQRQAGEQP